MKVRIGRASVVLAATASVGFYVLYSEDLSSLNVRRAFAGSRDTSPIRIWDLMPSDERDFITLVSNSAAAYRAGQPDAEEARTKEICKLSLSSKPIEGWIGRVSKVTTDDKGKVSFSLRIATDIVVTTDDEGLADPSATSSNVKISWLKEGEWLRFFGSFVKSNKDCITEIGVTPDALMTQPQFAFHFANFFGL